MQKYFKFFFLILFLILPTISKAKIVSYIEYYNKGMEFYEVGQYELALEEFNKGIEINPNYSD